MSTTTPVAPAPPETSELPDLGPVPELPVKIGPSTWLNSDGSTEGHDGFRPVRRLPPDHPVDRAAARLRYHQARLQIAGTALERLRNTLNRGRRPFPWETKELGPEPPPLPGRPSGDPTAALLRLEQFCRWHSFHVSFLTRRLAGTGWNPPSS